MGKFKKHQIANNNIGSNHLKSNLTFSGTTVWQSGATLAVAASGNLSIIGSAGTTSKADLLQVTAGASSYAHLNTTNLATLVEGGVADSLHTHTLKALGIKEVKSLSKTATQNNDTLTINFGSPAAIMIPSGINAATKASDINAFLNGQLIEYGASGNTWSWDVNTGTVTFNGSIAGDDLSIEWFAVAV